MDLNQLYSQHQISLIRADAAACSDGRAFHQTLAEGFARRIAQFRTSMETGDAGCYGAGTCS